VKVLLLHQHFNTPAKGGAIRSYYLAKALVDAGIHVTVITAHADKYKVESVEGIEVHFLCVPYDNRYGFYKRSVSFINYVWRTVSLARRLRGSDFCYAMSVPLTVGIAAMAIRMRHRIPFIFEVGDLWPDAPIQLGYIKNGLLKKLLYGLEKKIYNSARAIVALSPAIESAIKQKVSAKKNVHIIPNMSDTDFFRLQPKNSILQRSFKVENKFVVSYIGAIGVANGLHHFVDCARASKAAGLPVQFFLCGEGAELPALRQMVLDEALDNFTIIPFQNREGVRELLKVTDATFISYQPISILETGSPNKYFDGLAAGKLIIVNFGGWIKDEIEVNRCGFYVDQNSEGDFVKKITPFLYSEKLVKHYQLASRTLAENSYSRAMLSEKFVDIFIKN
jgi:glycosyltransferase involved in cell wall biosynthesis